MRTKHLKGGTKMQIRRAEYAEVQALDRLLQEAAQGLSPAIFCRDDQDFLAAHVKEQGFTLVAEEGDLAGMLVVRFPFLAADHLGRDLNWSDDLLLQACHIETLAVHPRYRGQGLQRALLLAAELELDALYTHLLATVAPANAASLRNFIRMGYGVVAEEAKYGGHERYILLKQR